MTVLLFTAAALLGTVAWSFGEYAMHRFAMHEMKGRGMPSREHLKHHAAADVLVDNGRWMSWASIFAVGLLVLLPVGTWLVSLAAGSGLAAGWIGGYSFYELVHWRAHRRPMANSYERWLRRHHFHHHFGHPMQNHGVTSPIWDMVFGTYVKPSVVKVPRRLAMGWLVDEAGEIRPEYATDYVLVGRTPLTDQQAEVDHARAFSNLAPAV